MLKATVNYKWENKQVEGYIIETFDDIEKLENFAHESGKKVVEKMLKTDLPVESFDHLHSGPGLQGGLTYSSYLRSRLKSGVNPIREVDNVVFDYLGTAENILSDMDVPVFINSVGGLTPVTKDIIEIIESTPIEEIPISRPQPLIRKKTKVINLENDPELENVSKDYMENFLKDNKFSCITEMRDFNYNELVEIFNDFKNKGGEIVYVYTTGGDVQQMYEYSKAAMESGLKEFIFDFNSGMNNDIKNFISWLSANVDVRLIDSQQQLKDAGWPKYKDYTQPTYKK